MSVSHDLHTLRQAQLCHIVLICNGSRSGCCDILRCLGDRQKDLLLCFQNSSRVMSDTDLHLSDAFVCSCNCCEMGSTDAGGSRCHDEESLLNIGQILLRSFQNTIQGEKMTALAVCF